MRRFLAIVLLALLPLQFSWAAVAAYCGHEAPTEAAHFGHHEHQHHDGIGAADDAEPVADAKADPGADKSPAAMDLDCGHCHGHCSVMPTPWASVLDALVTRPPRPALEEAGAARASARPERPQWRVLA